jgi:hypothetical protein
MDYKHNSEALLHLLNEEIIPFSIKDTATYKTLADKIGGARIVLMGEATVSGL